MPTPSVAKRNSPPDPSQYIDLENYPIDRLDSACRPLLARVREDLRRDGCAVLKSFVPANKIQELITEAESVAEFAHRQDQYTNPYFTQDDPNLAPDHPARRFYHRSNAFVPADQFGPNSILRAIYAWPEFYAFMQSALEEKEFYRYADPLADVIINVVESGEGFHWHFDTNNYTVTLSIQSAEQGGVFRYRPWMRSQTEENFAAVQAVLDGVDTSVKSLLLGDGDLQIFKGRYALHQVTPVRGNRPRYVGIFSFAEEAQMYAKPERCLQLYGKVLPIHYQRSRRRRDRLLD